ISGEDYAVPGRNALVLQTSDPREFVGLYHRLRADPAQLASIREAGRATAIQYAWPEILEREFLPRLDLLRFPATEELRPLPVLGPREARRSVRADQSAAEQGRLHHHGIHEFDHLGESSVADPQDERVSVVVRHTRPRTATLSAGQCDDAIALAEDL